MKPNITGLKSKTLTTTAVGQCVTVYNLLFIMTLCKLSMLPHRKRSLIPERRLMFLVYTSLHVSPQRCILT